MAATREDVIEFLKGMTLLEASQLVKELEETFGVSAAAATVASVIGTISTASAAHMNLRLSAILNLLCALRFARLTLLLGFSAIAVFT